ncbi:hypothetical protein A7A08_01086 [Methyloligella halotolerans]|uniref:UPF0235 protein A7A08_01086 n=2 Tax=Methyloligella TaxID=1485594 RepID=A0A1E2S0S1_9HYPH|nr:DUF167 family protein [Methyloligella halotolerans]ODA67919.1 hypothetical protein A7A08_01086 [Methyloligella halotolerans]
MPFRRDSEGVLLAVRLTPKSGRDQVEGIEEFDGAPVLKARVRAVPEDGKANSALEKLIAKWIGLPHTNVSVEKGGKSRLKQVRLEGDAETLDVVVRSRVKDLEA